LPKWHTYSDTNAYCYTYCDGHTHCDADGYPCRDTAAYSHAKGSSHAAASPLIFLPITLKDQ